MIPAVVPSDNAKKYDYLGVETAFNSEDEKSQYTLVRSTFLSSKRIFDWDFDVTSISDIGVLCDIAELIFISNGIKFVSNFLQNYC